MTTGHTDAPRPGDCIHHNDGSHTLVDEWYDWVYAQGKVGDWWWGQEIGWHDAPYVTDRILWIIVPLPAKRLAEGSYGPTTDAATGELIRIYPEHAGPTPQHPSGNWAAPGPVNGWDGNVDAPTLRPSIFVGGGSAHPGWHGWLTAGKLSHA